MNTAHTPTPPPAHAPRNSKGTIMLTEDEARAVKQLSAEDRRVRVLASPEVSIEDAFANAQSIAAALEEKRQEDLARRRERESKRPEMTFAFGGEQPPRVGRKPTSGSSEERRCVEVYVCLDGCERTLITSRAATLSLTVSDYMRRQLLGAFIAAREPHQALSSADRSARATLRYARHGWAVTNVDERLEDQNEVASKVA